MLFHMIILNILIHIKFSSCNSGTAVFYNKGSKSECWSENDILQLRARQKIDKIIPRINPDKVDAKQVKKILQFFRTSLKAVDKHSDPATYKLVQEAVADAIGAHLRSEILPAVRLAYYAGRVPYRNARQIHDLLEDVKLYLNTQGIGWKKPVKTTQKWSNLTVAKISIGAESFFDPCACLITKRDTNSCIHLPIPKHDDSKEPSAVALPFKSGGLVSLSSPVSNNMLLKYYTTAARCILSASPEKCRHSDFVTFNNDLWHWMKRDVAPHLMDEKLYSAYGGVLRIAAAVQNYGKGLSRRTQHSYETEELSSWNPWNTLTAPRIVLDCDWTPAVYILVVLLTAFSIYLVLIFYNYICGDSGGCSCKGNANSSRKTFYQTTNVEVSQPSQTLNEKEHTEKTKHPQHNQVLYTMNENIPSLAKDKSDTHGSVRNQKVYDFNENTEKMMEVFVSHNEESLDGESSSSEEGASQGPNAQNPPELQASMSQLTINKSNRIATQRPLYSTSTVRRKMEGSYRRDSESAWSFSETSISSISGSSTSCKSRRSRDISWARRVVSKNSLRNSKTASRTENDVTSYTTQTSQR